MSELGHGRLMHATRWRFGYFLSQAGLSLLLFACLAQVLPTDAFAAAALAQAVLVVAAAVADFGLSQAAVTALPARMAEEPEKRPGLLGGAARVFLWAAGATLIITALLALAVPETARVPTLLIGPAAGASVIVSGADGLLRAQGAFRRPVVLVTLNRLGALAALPVAALSHSASLTSAALSLGAVAMTVPAARVLVVAYQEAGIHRSGSDILRAAVPLGGAQLFILGSGRANAVILSTLISVRAAAAFEGAWRLFQLGQYAVGGLITAAAPFIGKAVGASDREQLRTLLLRLAALTALSGVLYGVALATVGPMLSRLLFGGIGDEVGDVLVPFALLSPVAFVGLLALTTLATSDSDRHYVLIAYGAGSALGVPLVVILGQAQGLEGAATGCALGLALAQLILIGRFLRFVRGAQPRQDDAGFAGEAGVARSGS